jgi:outer membrane protein assembly factor BamD
MPSLRQARAVFLAFLLSAPLLAGCSGDKAKDDYKERPVEDLYNDAMNLLSQEEYQGAAKAFDEVDRQHPYSVWATKAQLMAAYAQYQRNKFDEAIIALDRFIQLHPGHKDVAYAYYMKALCYYEQIADIQRDQKITDQAMKALQEVMDRFPTSKYARDAKLKLDLARDHLAGKEMAIGRYYEKQGLYLAAVNRFRNVVDNFQSTTHVPEALHRLIECYEALGLSDEAKKTAAVLGYNYPGSDWYGDSYSLVTGTPTEQSKSEAGWYTHLWPW